MSEEKAEGKRTGLAKWVTGVTVGVGIVATFLTNVDKIVELVKDQFGRGQPYEVTASVPEVLPYSLKNMLEGQDALYWFRATVVNKSKKVLHVRVTFQLLRGPAVLEIEKPVPYDVPPGKVRTETLNPGLKLLNHDFEDNLTVELTWEIQNDQRQTLGSDFRRINILPRNIVKWDLVTPEGDPVAKEFLLASLGAWVLSPGAPVRKAAGRAAAAPPATPDRWFQACYALLFESNSRLQIHAAQGAFPPEGNQRIRTPVEVLERNQAEPLEAALLLAAMTGVRYANSPFRMALFVLPEQNAPERQEFLLSWFDGSTGAWRAVNLNHAGTSSFQDNSGKASTLLQATLQRSPEILRTLDGKGVHLGNENALAALEFASASKRYGVRALP